MRGLGVASINFTAKTALSGDDRAMRTLPVFFRCVLLATACCGAVPVLAQSSQAEISARIMSKSLYLRGFWTDDKLAFDATGQPKKTYKTGSFTVSGFDPESVTLSGDKLKID